MDELNVSEEIMEVVAEEKPALTDMKETLAAIAAENDGEFPADAEKAALSFKGLLFRNCGIVGVFHSSGLDPAPAIALVCGRLVFGGGATCIF